MRSDPGIHTVVFDMDGVLSTAHRDRRLQLLARWSGRDPSEIDGLIFRSALEEEAERGLWSPEHYLREVGHRLGYPLSVEEWIEARRATTEPDPRLLAERLGTPPGSALFIDDDPAYVDGARTAGWHAVVHTGHAQLVEDLRAHGIVI